MGLKEKVSLSFAHTSACTHTHTHTHTTHTHHTHTHTHTPRTHGHHVFIVMLLLMLSVENISYNHTKFKSPQRGVCTFVARANLDPNFTSCSDNGKEIARGATKCNFSIINTASGIYPKISLLPVLSQINTIASFVKVKISVFQTRFHNG